MQRKELEHLKDMLLTDLKELVAIPSVSGMAKPEKQAPFGEEVRHAFDCFARIAEEKGFLVEDDEGYAVSAQIGSGEDYIGVLGHLDVVSSQDPTLWNTPPFEMVNKEGILYGRGVNDDKGPLLAALYATWLLQKQQLPLRYPIRIIAGGAEETTWECMKHYFKGHKQPICGFSPDGNFPIVNGEKGILQVAFQFPIIKGIYVESAQRLNFVCDHLLLQLPDDEASLYANADHVQRNEGMVYATYRGKRTLSRNPQRGENALFSFVRDVQERCDLPTSFQNCIALLKEQFCDDFYGKKSGIYCEDAAMGTTSVCPMSLTCNEEKLELCVDIRYVKSTSEDKIIQKLTQMCDHYHATMEILTSKPLLYVDENSELIQALKTAYHRVMHEDAEVLTKGGASYARVLTNGVAFGATFPNEDPKPHMPNECMPIESLLKACEIYYEALYELAVDKERLSNN